MLFATRPAGSSPVLLALSLAAGTATTSGPLLAQPDTPPDTEAAETGGDNMDEIVVIGGEFQRYSAMKADAPIMETARSVSIETQLDLRNKGALDLVDAYLYSAGVFGETYGYATRGDWVKVRGLDAPEYRDSLQALFGSYNNTRPHPYALEQVEVLKGPASVLYGQGSPGGLVNVVSKRPRADMDSEVFLRYGNDDRWETGVDIGGSLTADDTLLYRLIAVGRDSDTQVDYIHDDTALFAPSLSWRPSERTEITLLGSFQDTDSRAGAQFVPIAGTLRPAPNGRFIDDSAFLGEPSFDRYDTRKNSVTVLANHAFNAVWSLETTARWTAGKADYNQAWPSFIGGDRYVRNPDGSLYGDGRVPRTFYTSDAESNQRAVDTRLHADFAHGIFRHEVMMGVQYQHVTTENDSANLYAYGYDPATGQPDDTVGDTFWIDLFDPTYGNVPPQAAFDAAFTDGPEATTRDLGVYVNDQVRVGNLRITGGARFDQVRTDDGTQEQDETAVSYSGGLLYTFANGIAPYVSYAESFEPVLGVDNVTQRALEPREGRQYEAGIKYRASGFPLQATLAAFDIKQSNLDTPGGLPDAPSQQEGVANVEGVELETLTHLGDFTLEVNASHLDTENANGFRFASIPSDQASAWLGYRVGPDVRGIRAAAGVRYIGESRDGADNVRTPSYTLGDLMLGYGFGRWDVSLNVRNVTDKEYLVSCLARGDCYFGERRQVVGTIRYAL